MCDAAARKPPAAVVLEKPPQGPRRVHTRRWLRFRVSGLPGIAVASRFFLLRGRIAHRLLTRAARFAMRPRPCCAARVRAGPARGVEPDRPANAPAAYLITFACYGIRLHGNAFGSVDRDHNLPGSRYLSADMPRERAEARAMRQPRYELDRSRRELVVAAIRELSSHRGWPLHAVHARPTHVHVVVTAPVSPEKGHARLQGVCLANFDSRGFRSSEATPLEPPRQHALFVGARSCSVGGRLRLGRARRANGDMAAALTKQTEPRASASGVR